MMSPYRQTNCDHVEWHTDDRSVGSFTNADCRQPGFLAPGVKWSVTKRFSLMGPSITEESLAEKRAELLLARHGVVTKRAIEIDRLGWEWRPIYSALSLMELRGTVRRGYFVNGLPGVQFAESDFVDLMREPQDGGEISVISAADPAYVFDSRLASESADGSSELLDVSRIGSTRVVFCNGQPVLVASSNGARIEIGNEPDDVVQRAMEAVVNRISSSATDRRVVVSQWEGAPVLSSNGTELLASIGFRRDYPNMVFDALSMAATRR